MTAGCMSICDPQRNRTAGRSFLLSADIWNCPKRKQSKTLFLKGLSQRFGKKSQKTIRLAAYYSLCRHRLHKYPPKKKVAPKPKRRYSISSTASKSTLIPAFDGSVMAMPKRIVPTLLKGSTILQYRRQFHKNCRQYRRKNGTD